MHCPLCENIKHVEFSSDKHRDYYQCNNCELIFVSPNQRPLPSDEKARYMTHNNDDDNEGYVRFLSRIIDPLSNRVHESAKGLDYGCGPNPVLSKLLSKRGFDMSYFDPFFFNTRELLDKKYDFIVYTEVAEHMFDPQREFEFLFSRLSGNGTLALMTNLYTDKIDFDKWHYKNDTTHVCFYTEKSIKWISTYFNYKAEVILPDLIFFKK
ncbi:MAG: methyltransferase [Salinivirgaceae bacterium]|nr:MAG: methyltransferase [Salinivirgaceae bacterium]